MNVITTRQQFLNKRGASKEISRKMRARLVQSVQSSLMQLEPPGSIG